MAKGPYPTEEDDDVERVPLTVRVPAGHHEEIELIAQLWNEFDVQLAKKKAKKWKSSSVIERFIALGIDSFWDQVGGRPATKEGREEFIARAVEKLHSSRKKQQ